MKCYSIAQPWATLVALGVQKIFTHSRALRFNGPVLIYASAEMPKDGHELRGERWVKMAMRRHGWSDYHNLPMGVIVGQVQQIACIKIKGDSHMPYDWRARALSDFSPGRFSLIFASPKVALNPIPWRGSINPTEVPEKIVNNLELVPWQKLKE